MISVVSDLRIALLVGGDDLRELDPLPQFPGGHVEDEDVRLALLRHVGVVAAAVVGVDGEHLKYNNV